MISSDFDKFSKLYDFTIRCIDREDLLVNNRLIWALQVNIALIALLYNIDNFTMFGVNQEILKLMVCLSGIILTSFSFIAIRAAKKQLSYLKKTLVSAAKNIDFPFIESQGSEVVGKNEQRNNIIHIRTGFPRPFGWDGYKIGEAGSWVPAAYAVTIVIFWFAAICNIKYATIAKSTFGL